MAAASTSSDAIQPFFVRSLGLRGRLVRLGPCFESVVAGHGYPQPAAELLGEALGLACALASGLKFDGTFILQTRSDGPVDLMVAHVTSQGEVRGYARCDAARLWTRASGAPVPRLLGAGHLAFTVDQGPSTERYQGITELSGATLADCARNYFERSEQLATAVELVARSSPEGWRTAALIVQRLPGEGEESEEAWRRSLAVLGTVEPEDLLDFGLAPIRLIARLYGITGIAIPPSRPLRYACGCSRRRVALMLASFPRSEIASLAEQGRVTVTCEFCKTAYAFTVAEVEGLASPPPASP